MTFGFFFSDLQLVILLNVKKEVLVNLKCCVKPCTVLSQTSTPPLGGTVYHLLHRFRLHSLIGDLVNRLTDSPRVNNQEILNAFTVR